MNENLKKLIALIVAALARQWAHAQALRRGWSNEAAWLASLAAGAIATLAVSAL